MLHAARASSSRCSQNVFWATWETDKICVHCTSKRRLVRTTCHDCIAHASETHSAWARSVIVHVAVLQNWWTLVDGNLSLVPMPFLRMHVALLSMCLRLLACIWLPFLPSPSTGPNNTVCSDCQPVAELCASFIEELNSVVQSKCVLTESSPACLSGMPPSPSSMPSSYLPSYFLPPPPPLPTLFLLLLLLPPLFLILLLILLSSTSSSYPFPPPPPTSPLPHSPPHPSLLHFLFLPFLPPLPPSSSNAWSK